MSSKELLLLSYFEYFSEAKLNQYFNFDCSIFQH